MKRYAATLLLAAGLLLPATAAAQARGVFAPGSQLRVEAPGYTPGRVAGTVQAFTHEGLFLKDAASGEVYRIPSPSDIGYLAHYKGYDRGYSAKKLALPSAFIAGALGALAGPVLAIARHDDDGMLRSAFVYGVSGALVGGLGGGVYGATHVREEWKVYRLRPVAGVGRATSGAGVELRLSVR